MRHLPFRRALLAAAVLSTCALPALAHDGFKVRFPLSGTLGGEIVAPVDNPGFFGSLVVTQIELDKVTDDTGKARQQTNSGRFSTPAPVAGVVRTATYSGPVNFDLKQSQTNTNLILGYLSEGFYGGGRLSLVLNMAYTARLDRQLTLSGATPTLSTLSPALTTPPLPAGTAAAAQAAAQNGFNTGYQAQLAAQSAGASGVVDGIGDTEITAAWVYRQDTLKVITGLTVALPTGKYEASDPLSVGFGNFYTVRPGVAVAFNASPNWTLGARGSLAFNTRNKDNHIKSGNFGTLDLAAAYRSPIGVFGPHLLMVHQYEDDNGGNIGPNRFRATGAGVFFTTLVPGLGAALNLSYMKMLSAKNALSGAFFQVRASKAF
jgi:hypothetical protein